MKKTYISAGKEFNDSTHHVSAPIFRKLFDFDGEICKIEIAVCGLYRLFLNDNEITKGYMAPYLSNPDQLVMFDEYDVTSLVKKKDNDLCILLGNGFNNSLDFNVWQFQNASYRSAPKLYLTIYKDNVPFVTTDESFLVYNSPITFDDYRAGERFDARLIDSMFDKSFKPIIVDSPKGEYRKCNATPLKIFGSKKAVSIIESEGGFIYDFGENNAGVCALTIDGKSGQQIDIYCGEMLIENKFTQENIMFGDRTKKEYCQHEQYICKDGLQTYMPSFTYHGFRFAFIKGVTKEQANKDLLTFMFIHSDCPIHGKFSCDNDVINKLQEMSVKSDLTNFHYFPTDCPQREKNGWTGDIALSSEQFMYNLECKSSFKEWLHAFKNAQKENGAVSCIVPCASWGYDWGAGMGWDTVMADLPLMVYRFTGDVEVLMDIAPVIEKYIPYFESKFNEDGLTTFGLGDWCDAGRHDYVSNTPVEVSDSLLAIDFLNNCSKIFKILENNELAKKLLKKRDVLIANFRKKHIDKDMFVTGKSEAGQSWAILYGIFNEDEEEIAYKNLIDIIHRDNDNLSCGALGVKALFKVLSNHGDSALALKIITKKTYPNYGLWVEQGTDTLGEGFFDLVNYPFDCSRKDGVREFQSFNHHFWGTISAWFYRYLGGIDVVSSDEIIISPHYVVGINRVNCEYGTNGKNIVVNWEKNGDKIVVKIVNTGFNCYYYDFSANRKVKLEQGENIITH